MGLIVRGDPQGTRPQLAAAEVPHIPRIDLVPLVELGEKSHGEFLRGVLFGLGISSVLRSKVAHSLEPDTRARECWHLYVSRDEADRAIQALESVRASFRHKMTLTVFWGPGRRR